MIRYFPLSILIFLVFSIVPGFAQESIAEKDFTVRYFPNRLELAFDKAKAPNSIKVTDVFSKKKLQLRKLQVPIFLLLIL